MAREAEEAALREIEREQAEALKHKLPDFWLPSLTPTYTSSGPPTSLSDVKLQTTCRAAIPSHALTYVVQLTSWTTTHNRNRRKNLIEVKFTMDTSSSGATSSSLESTPLSSADAPRNKGEEAEPMCPSCKKGFSNSILMFCTSTSQFLSSLTAHDYFSNEAVRTRYLQNVHGLACEAF